MCACGSTRVDDEERLDLLVRDAWRLYMGAFFCLFVFILVSLELITRRGWGFFFW